ncbi:hypothetical protein F5Y19DRAFT_465095 [Xylariaceae sp. FL1651]|nr:hypothetical protein F5Y19DRAFT_465095 [Xylariaceae sp. FL1651]
MAPPPKGQPKSARAASGHAKKHHPAPTFAAATNRPVVLPAIPLPLLHKRSTSNRNNNTTTKSTSKHAPTASASSNGLPVSSLEAALIDHDSVHGADMSENETQGQKEEKPGHADASFSGDVEQPQPSPLQKNDTSKTNTESQQSPAASVIDADVFSLTLTAAANGGPLYTSQPQSAISTTRPEFPSSFPAPSYLPQHQQMGDQHHHHAAFHTPHPHRMHPHQHRHQMSNGGGIMFGGFDSHTPSPAPPPGSFMPPPHPPVNGENRGHPRPNGHHHAHSNSNGFPGPINTHFRDMVPMSTMDAYGPVPAPVPPIHFEAYPPGIGRYGPPTPHSFHGSHTSGEQNGLDSAPIPYPPNGSYPAGPSRHEHPAAHPHPPGPFPPFMHPQPFSQINVAQEEAIQGVSYIRNQFDNKELADCVLELVFTKGRHPPAKISGHKLILAHSPALRQYIMTARATDSGSHTITMEIDDPYLLPEAWWTAVQRLYLYPLLPPPPIVSNSGNGMDFAGDKVTQFEFCLGYAAAGHILAMQDVLVRGLQIAANLLTWETIEKGLGFVLEGTTQRHYDYRAESEEADMPPTLMEFGYGPETKILMAAILNFLINDFPSNFELNTSVSDPPKIARLPTSIAATMKPAIARGTTTRHPTKPTRLSSIKFGDLPAAYPEDGPTPHREPAKCSSILSRILLNLPHDALCEVLTSAQDRYHAVVDVVAEREARRLRAVDVVRSGSVPHAHEIQLRLSAQRRYAIAEEWDVLNWQEEVICNEVPRIVRRWVPQFDVPQPVSQQQIPPSYDTLDSMV